MILVIGITSDPARNLPGIEYIWNHNNEPLPGPAQPPTNLLPAFSSIGMIEEDKDFLSGSGESS
jgi:hypothetical protein